MMGLVVISSLADQGGPLAYAKEFLIPSNTLLESLTCVNKGASACYIQLFDTPRKLAIAITDTDNTTDVITAAGHQLVTGDAVTLTGIDGITEGFVQVIDADTFYVFETRAGAIDETVGAVPLTPTNDDETGTVELTSDATSAPVAEEYPVAAAADAPSNVLSFAAARFHRGLYVRAVTAINGSTLISGDDIKFTPRYRTGDIIKSQNYED